MAGGAGAARSGPTAHGVAVSRAAAYAGQGLASRSIGRVFFSLGRQNFGCSGTAVISRNRSTVVTAAHCVNAGPGPFVRNWMFVPGYVNGRRPYGTWTARALYAPRAWVRSGRSDDDVGFAVVNRVHGRYLTDLVHGLALAFNRPRGPDIWAFGYPVTAPNSGRHALYCAGRLRPDPYRTGAQGLQCTLSAGASGGPWLVGFSPQTGSGVVYSVTSFTYQGMRGVVWGPYLGHTAAATFAQAQSG